MRFAFRKLHGHAAGRMLVINLHSASVDWHGIKQIDGLAAKLVPSNAAENGSVISQSTSHDGKVCRSAAKKSGQ